MRTPILLAVVCLCGACASSDGEAKSGMSPTMINVWGGKRTVITRTENGELRTEVVGDDATEIPSLDNANVGNIKFEGSFQQSSHASGGASSAGAVGSGFGGAGASELPVQPNPIVGPVSVPSAVSDK